MARPRTPRSLLGAVALLALYIVARSLGVDLPLPDLGGGSGAERSLPEVARSAPAPAPEHGSLAEGSERLAALYRERRSDAWVEASGVVVKKLRDDDRGSRHQKFLVRVSPDQTLLFAHNIDLAPRIPLDQGDRIAFRGQYEWTEKGGVVHWTHHDPEKRHPGGWIDLEGQRYR